MNILSFPKMVISSSEGWPELAKIHPAIIRVFFFLVLPFSLLPPAMLYLSSIYYGDSIIAGFGSRPWELISPLFFIAEMVTFVAMGWLIKQIAEDHQVDVDYHDAYVLAAITPVPLWLSSLGLLVPSLAFNMVVSILALGASCALIYHGIYALCHMHEEVTAASITQAVIGAGLSSWAILLVVIMAI
ncbi:MAG: YIP1 family protein [Sulfuricella denitrificans]|nr:YIP1 family protein [Sulfuricella denitrificans]